MTVRPEYGPEYGEEERRDEGLLPVEHDSLLERQLEEHEEEEQNELVVDAEDNELRAPGRRCARCGQVIAAGEDVRRRADGTWQHEACPVGAGGPASQPG